MNLLLEFPVAASLAACILQFGSAWKALGKGRRAIEPADDGDLPGVSILKPLKGVDDRLLDNLESFCRLDYPRYEIVFCVQGASDPALRVARKVKETHPGREIVNVVAAAKMTMDFGMQRMLGDRSSPGWILLGPIRDVLAGGLWFSAFFSQNVEWRGRAFRVTRGSRLVPVGEAPGMEPTAEAAR